jgi:hypothetical protein
MVWALVQPGIAGFTRVCSYDRTYEGWSDAGPGPQSMHQQIYELHKLLEAARLRPPYNALRPISTVAIGSSSTEKAVDVSPVPVSPSIPIFQNRAILNKALHKAPMYQAESRWCEGTMWPPSLVPLMGKSNPATVVCSSGGAVVETAPSLLKIALLSLLST